MEHHGREPYDKARLVQEEPRLARTNAYKHEGNTAFQEGEGRYDHGLAREAPAAVGLCGAGEPR